MSRPLPPASGIPVKTLIRGEDGKQSEARDLASELQGQIGQFVVAARTNLDQLAVGSVTREIPQGVLRFSKNNGQEQLIVTLRPPVVVETSEDLRPVVPVYPDYCVVDLVLRDEPDLELRIIAIGVRPAQFLGDSFAGEFELDYPEDAPTYSSGKDPGRALIKYSRHAPRNGSLGTPVRVSSLLFDLREIAPGERVEVDLWGAYFPEEEEEEEDPDDDTFLIPLERVSIRSHTIWRGDEFTEPQFGWHEVRANTGDGPLLDPLGNLTFWEGPLFIAAFFAAMALDDWDETEYTEGDANGQFAFLLPSSPLPNPPPGGFQVLIYPAGYYTQKRYDTETGELIDVRRIMHAGNGWGQQVDSDTRAAIELSFWEQIVPPDEEPYELDITTQFYIGTELKSYDTAHKDAAGIWSVSAQLPERRQIASVPIKNDKGDNTQEFSTNSGKLSKLGSIIVDRAGSSTTFVPA